MKKFIKAVLPAIDLALMPPTFLAAVLMKGIRSAGIARMPLCKRALKRAGIFPLRNHYYEPLFDARLLRHPTNLDRHLPGINWNTDTQLKLLSNLNFSSEITPLTNQKTDELVFHFGNSSFESGDAEYLYNIIRYKKPKKIIEIGSGNSTLIAILATKKNSEENPLYKCNHVCIEPYEVPWLEQTCVKVVREKVEDIAKSIFAELERDDLLFIDSSHMIRPQGDVLCEYLEIIPTLSDGVIVHIHDIFSPKDYLSKWIVEDVCFWNEQYLLEAFLSCNNQWEIIGALNYLHHNHYSALKQTCPFLTQDREPGSFYMQKTPSTSLAKQATSSVMAEKQNCPTSLRLVIDR